MSATDKHHGLGPAAAWQSFGWPLACAGLIGALCLAVAVAVRGYSRSDEPPPAPAAHTASAREKVTPEMVPHLLGKAGYSHVANLRQRGPNFTADVSMPGGSGARVVVSGASGQIIGMRLVDREGQQAARDAGARNAP